MTYLPNPCRVYKELSLGVEYGIVGQAGIYKPMENLLVKKVNETGTIRGESSKITDAGNSVF